MGKATIDNIKPWFRRLWRWLAGALLLAVCILTALFWQSIFEHLSRYSAAYSVLAALMTAVATIFIARFSAGTYRMFEIEQQKRGSLQKHATLEMQATRDLIHLLVSFYEVLENKEFSENWIRDRKYIGRSRLNVESSMFEAAVRRIQSLSEKALELDAKTLELVRTAGLHAGEAHRNGSRIPEAAGELSPKDEHEEPADVEEDHLKRAQQVEHHLRCLDQTLGRLLQHLQGEKG